MVDGDMEELGLLRAREEHMRRVLDEYGAPTEERGTGYRLNIVGRMTDLLRRLTGRDGRQPIDGFTIRWDASMSCYRVSVPELDMAGEGVEVVRREDVDRLEAEARTLHREREEFRESAASYRASMNRLFGALDEVLGHAGGFTPYDDLREIRTRLRAAERRPDLGAADCALLAGLLELAADRVGERETVVRLLRTLREKATEVGARDG